MFEYIFLILLFFVLWWFLVKSFDWIDGRCKTEINMIVLAPYLDKPNYGIFYNPLIQDKRDFNIGHKVFFYGEKYYVVGIEYNNIYKSWVALHLSKTMNDVMYKDDGLVVDSREVKRVMRID